MGPRQEVKRCVHHNLPSRGHGSRCHEINLSSKAIDPILLVALEDVLGCSGLPPFTRPRLYSEANPKVFSTLHMFCILTSVCVHYLTDKKVAGAGIEEEVEFSVLLLSCPPQ